MKEFIILLASVLAGMATYAASNILGRGPVTSSAIVTLIGGMLLPYFFPNIGPELAAAVACSSYAGMISMENALNLVEMSIISLMTGILYVGASAAYIGVGGRLGTIAAISCFAWLGFKKVFVGVDNK